MSGKNDGYMNVYAFAQKVNKSPQWIYKKMKQGSELARYTKVINGRKMLHQSAIWEVFGVDYDGYKPDDKPVYKEEDTVVTVLSEQVKAQQSQIEAMQKTIDGLTEALKAEQILRANIDQKLAQLIDKQFTQDQEPEADDPEVEHDPEVEREPSLMKRILRALGF